MQSNKIDHKNLQPMSFGCKLVLQSIFGVGTFFTNDFCLRSDRVRKSKPLNIVIKISKAASMPCVKLSDDFNKNTGDRATIKKVKLRLSYEESHDKDLDEADRLWETLKDHWNSEIPLKECNWQTVLCNKSRSMCSVEQYVKSVQAKAPHTGRLSWDRSQINFYLRLTLWLIVMI